MEKDERLHLVILGGGHVGHALCRLASVMGYDITVMDDREEFASPGRFPEADRVICAPFAQLEQRIPPLENSYYVIVTRGHQGDFQCADLLLGRRFAYLGMIGSKKKVKEVRQRLLEAGHAWEQVEQIWAPIGLKLGGNEPEEIAVSILAQIVQVRNLSGKEGMSQQVQKALAAGIGGVLVTIVEKSGSAPRGVGCAMLVADDGTVYGTIGGGVMEHQAILDAGSGRKFPAEIRYDLSSGEAGALGMVCGGSTLVRMERKPQRPAL